MKKILLKAYTELNIGDDLFIEILLKRYPLTNFYIECDQLKYKHLSEKFDNLYFLPRFHNKTLLIKSVRKVVKLLAVNQYTKFFNIHYKPIFKNMDAVIVIGGSMFIELKNKKARDLDLLWYNYIINYHPDVPLFFIGCNFGPFKTDIYFKNYEKVFSHATDVCFRDQYSFSLFNHLKNVRVAPDIVFGYQTKQIQISSDEKIVGFSIVPANKSMKKFDEDNYFFHYLELIRSYIKGHSKIRLFSFCSNEGDSLIIDTLLRNLTEAEKRNVECVYYSGDTDLFLRLFQQCSIMYCGRFHALILSMLFQQKILPVIYSDKMKNVLNDIGYQNELVEIDKFSEVSISDLTEFVNNQYSINDAKILSENHFKMIDLFLN